MKNFFNKIKNLNIRKVIFSFLTLIIIFGLILYLNHYPNYLADKNTPDGFVYSGHAAWFDPWDINAYYSVIKSGQTNGILLTNFYTTDINKPIIFYPLYTITGTIFKNMNVNDLYDNLKIITLFIILTVFLVCSLMFLRNFYSALLAFFLFSFIRGLGWIFKGNYHSPDLYMTSFTIRSAFQRPHEAVGIALYFLSVTFLYLFFIKGRFKYIFLSLLSNILLLFFYPYYYLNYLLIFLIMIFVSRAKIKINLFIFVFNALILSVLALNYYFYLQNSGFASQITEIQPKLSIAELLTGYGIFIPIFLYTFITIKNTQKDFKLIFLSVWIIISLLLSYLPIGYSRFFLRGLFFPFSLLTVILFQKILNGGKKPFFKFLVLSILIIGLALQIPTTFYIYYQRIRDNNLNNYWFYFPKLYKDSFDYLNSENPGGVISGYFTGNIIPVYTNKPVYLGHIIQTPNAGYKMENVLKLYSNKLTTQEAKNFLIKNNIKYVFYGNEEKSFGKASYNFLQPIYSNKMVTIYKIK